MHTLMVDKVQATSVQKIPTPLIEIRETNKGLPPILPWTNTVSWIQVALCDTIIFIFLFQIQPAQSISFH